MKLQIAVALTSAILMTNVSASDGKELYGQLCASCHAPNSSPKLHRQSLLLLTMFDKLIHKERILFLKLLNGLTSQKRKLH